MAPELLENDEDVTENALELIKGFSTHLNHHNSSSSSNYNGTYRYERLLRI